MIFSGSSNRLALVVALLFCGFQFGIPIAASATEQVTLAWQPSSDPSVTGYNVYYGTSSHTYDHKATVAQPTVIVPGLIEGLTYYFAVTAFTQSGAESAPSNEVTYLVPGVLLNMIKPVSGSIVITSPGAARFAWVLESTTNLKTWKTVSTGSNSVVNISVPVSSAPMQFFRLRSQ